MSVNKWSVGMLFADNNKLPIIVGPPVEVPRAQNSFKAYVY